MAVTPLVLAGGRSTRMQSPKHLLRMPDGRPLYQHQIAILARACPQSPVIYVSLAQDSQLDGFLRERVVAAKFDENETSRDEMACSDVRVIFDLDANETSESSGPASGLLAAFASQPENTWLVIPCDCPFVSVELLEKLRRQYRPPVTCYRNNKGFCEPLVGLWSPDALARLAERAKDGKVGPSSVVRELGGKQIELPAGADRPLADVNTKDEWETALALLNTSGGTVSGG
ncbi:hypothetical protein VUR80DRAFT_3748 [Thermomyces stellatus]